MIDLRSLVPLDRDTILDSVRKTGHCVVLHEAPRTLGMGAEIAALVQEHGFWHLEAPVLRATGFDTPYPPARLEGAWLPGVDRLLDCVAAIARVRSSMSAVDTIREFRLPDLGEGLEDATIVEWSVAIGDTIVLNQVVCVVETEKASVDLPSPFAGRVVETVGEPGATVPVGTVLLRVEVPGSVEIPGAGEVTWAVEDAPVGLADVAVSTDTPPPILVGYGPDESQSGRRRRVNGPEVDPSLSEPAPAPTGTRPLASPPVRKLARDRGIDLAALAPGSGPGGAVVREDVLRAVAGTAAAQPAAPVRCRGRR